MTTYDPHGYYMDTPQPKIQNELTPHLLLKTLEKYFRGHGLRINHCYIPIEDGEDWSLEVLVPSQGWTPQYRASTLAKLAGMIQNDIDRFESSQQKEQTVVQ